MNDGSPEADPTGTRPPATPAPPPKVPWLKRLRSKTGALIVGGLVVVASGFLTSAKDWVWNHLTGQDRAELTVLEVRVAGETATDPNYNADALQRIVANDDFPHIELLLRNTGGKTGTVEGV